MTLLQLIRERTLALPDDDDLLDELRNVRLRESSPGVYRLGHDRNRHDDRAVALALAASLLAERGTPGRARTWSSFRHAARGLTGMERQAALGIGRPTGRGIASEEALERRLRERGWISSWVVRRA